MKGMRDIDTRALFMKEVDEGEREREEGGEHVCHGGHHSHHEYSKKQVALVLPRPKEEVRVE